MKIKGLQEKWKQVFVPTVLGGLVAVLLYGFVIWLVVWEFQLLEIGEVWREFVWPFVGIFALGYFFLYRQLRFLDFRDNEERRFVYCVVFAAILGLVNLMMLEYVEAITGQMVTLPSIEAYDGEKEARYLQLERYEVGLDDREVYLDSRASDGDEKWRMFVVAPLMGASGGEVESGYPHWVGVMYKETVAAGLEEDIRESAWEDFVMSSMDDFEAGAVFESYYLERTIGGRELEGFEEAWAKHAAYSEGAEVRFFQPRFRPFESRGEKEGKGLLIFGVVGLLVWFVMLLFPGYKSEEARRQENDAVFEAEEYFERGIDRGLAGEETEGEVVSRGIIERGVESAANMRKKRETDWDYFKELLIPRKDYWVSLAFGGVMVVVYLVMVVSGIDPIEPSSKDLLAWGGSYWPNIEQGEWWRIFASMFVHIGAFHLVWNLIILLFLGSFLEEHVHPLVYIKAFFVTGVCAEGMSLWWNEPMVAVGASGALYGLAGMVMVLAWFKRKEDEIYWYWVGGAFLFFFATWLPSLLEGGDIAAHVGGMLSGMLFGLGYEGFSRIRGE